MHECQEYQTFKRQSYYKRFVVLKHMVFNATFNNISVISWWSVLLMEETEKKRIKRWNDKEIVIENKYASRKLKRKRFTYGFWLPLWYLQILPNKMIDFWCLTLFFSIDNTWCLFRRRARVAQWVRYLDYLATHTILSGPRVAQWVR
jgi:hypothetical protein